MSVKNKQAFVDWLAKHEPHVYDMAVKSVGLGDSSGGWLDSIIGAVTTNLPKIAEAGMNAASSYITTKSKADAQKHEKSMADLQLQIQRAQLNQAPVQTPNYTPTVTQPIADNKMIYIGVGLAVLLGLGLLISRK